MHQNAMLFAFLRQKVLHHVSKTEGLIVFFPGKLYFLLTDYKVYLS
jgi:hypothetical protein